MRISEQEYQNILAKMHKPIPDDPHQADDEPESTLSKHIREHCKTNGWPALVLPQNKALSWFIPEGYPDATLFLSNGRIVVLELKSRTGRLREAQRLMRGMFIQLGHEWYQCRTWKRYLEIVYGQTKQEQP